MTEPALISAVSRPRKARLAKRQSIPAMLTGLARFGFDATVLPLFFLATAGYFGRAAWLFDIVNFFRPHVAALTLLLLLVSMLSSSPVRIGVALLLFLASLFPLVTLNVPRAAAAPSGNFRVLNANVMGARNSSTDAFRALVARANPDVVVTEETNGIWRAALASLPTYPYVEGSSLGPLNSVAVASRYPIKASPISLSPDAMPNPEIGGGVPLRVEIARPGATRPLILYAIHPPTPRSWIGWKVRNQYLSEIADKVAADAAMADVVVSGDWNTPSWSPFFTDSLTTAGLLASERSTWPSPTRIFREFGLPEFMGSPIDHIAVTRGVGVASLAIGEDINSDHLPVIADLALP